MSAVAQRAVIGERPQLDQRVAHRQRAAAASRPPGT
jgi:hypothetical protein